MPVSDFPNSIMQTKLVEPPIIYPVTRLDYDDGGQDVNVAPCGLKRWLLTYEGLDPADFQTLIDHFNEAQGPVGPFNFTGPRDAVAYTGVTYESLNVPPHPKIWSLNLEIVLRAYV